MVDDSVVALAGLTTTLEKVTCGSCAHRPRVGAGGEHLRYPMGALMQGRANPVLQ